MKKILFFLILSIVTFNSCKKDDNPVVTNGTTQIWHMVNDAGEIAEVEISPFTNSGTFSETGNSTHWYMSYPGGKMRIPVSGTISHTSQGDHWYFTINIQNGGVSLIGTGEGYSNGNFPDAGSASGTVRGVATAPSMGSQNVTGSWTATRSNGSTTTGVPTDPVLSSPADGASNLLPPFYLSWGSCSGATSYTVNVSKSSSFTNLDFNLPGLTNLVVELPGLTASTTYYWRIKAVNSYGSSTWSPVRKFTTGSLPAVPVLLSPLNGAANQSITPTLSWNSSNGATSYSLQVSTSNSFTDFIFNQSGITYLNQQISGLNSSTNYYWRVNAVNGFGSSDWTAPWNFTTGIPPSPPILSFPANGSINQSTTPVLSWNPSNGAGSYTLQVSTSNSFTDFIFNQSGITGLNQQISSLDNSTNYYWRVSATSNLGMSNWSTVWSFKTSLPPYCAGLPSVTYAGKIYTTVQIGSQCWLRENLDIGNMIHGRDTLKNNGIIEKYCYNDDTSNCTTYGGLYQWNEAMQYVTTEGTQGICPTGWHIPTIAELQTLTTKVNNHNALIAVGQGTGVGAGTNTSGFSALFAGYRLNLNFIYLKNGTYFWSSTENSSSGANYMSLVNDGVGGFYGGNKQDYGFSVRCLKD